MMLCVADSAPGAVRPGGSDQHGVGHRQCGSQQHQLAAAAQHKLCRRPGPRRLLGV